MEPYVYLSPVTEGSVTERLKAIENGPWSDDERDTLKPCRTFTKLLIYGLFQTG